MKRVCLWGTGIVAREVMDNCNTLFMYKIVSVVDSNPKKWGDLFYGYTISSPEVILDNKIDVIVILADAYLEIYNQIKSIIGDSMVSIENKNFFYKESILRRYSQIADEEVNEILQFISKEGLDVFNYDFRNNYDDINYSIMRDDNVGLFYVIHDDRRMYFSKKYVSEEAVKKYYRSIIMEQDEKSPHKYLNNIISVNNGDVVVDVGVAEGNFALEVIDKVRHLYLVESDEDWVEALKYTFRDYLDKVTFINGYVSSYNEGKTITLDSVINERVDFIKMDIEGNEWDALVGCERLINESLNMKFAICSYHGDFDQELIEGFFDKHGIKHFSSFGYMWYPWKVRQTYVSTKLNRGLIYGIKE